MEDKGQQWRQTRNKGEYEYNYDEEQHQGTMLNNRTARMKDNIMKDYEKDDEDKDWVYISF